MGSGPRWSERCGGKLLPRAPVGRHEHDRSEHLAVTMSTPATALRPRRNLWHYLLEQGIRLIGRIPSELLAETEGDIAPGEVRHHC
ncbi:hypothetical protein SVEN_7401 [Streptomyces venezuelae ATCC 10712]|uniref:Uncharacterized protein n=1 Tax=Streptomyces venezuelae (strain ATCC 10712 / CBS 650.69 / DSM 40230 / JCM 4526 / NBRC 13096 / PD 04745) TaxID=953739 RepID=F2R220_STRVP|nr:hypothetical protein SVEN_7401 [Streptomyces venezuelae ATCC 10712]